MSLNMIPACMRADTGRERYDEQTCPRVSTERARVPCHRRARAQPRPGLAPRACGSRVNRMIVFETRWADLAWGSGGRRGWSRKCPGGAGPRRRGPSPWPPPPPEPRPPPPWRCCPRRSCCSPAPPSHAPSRPELSGVTLMQEDHPRLALVSRPFSLAASPGCLLALLPRSSAPPPPAVALSGSWGRL
jgi:hypothetical protein